MPIGGFGGPSGRRVHSVERALAASALLPTAAFTALGSLSVLLVVQMGISPLVAISGPSARDGGHSVTMPRMSISIDPQRLQFSSRSQNRKTTTAVAPTMLDFAHPGAQTIAPTRGHETTTTADAPTGPTRPTTFMFVRFVAHTIPPARDRKTTALEDQPAARTVKGVVVTKAAVTGVEATSAVTTWEVTTAAAEPQVQAGKDATDAPNAPDATFTLLARAATAPAPEPADPKSQTPPKDDTSAASAKTPHTTGATQASGHAKAAKFSA
ncbi:MAG: hypothetical protein HHJ11_01445 [Phycicoccus sp.]|nr:hypothetical protein [Phycicoccus sp.]NMM34021.1 hypothetical protein [Phycicoccus sp.]